MEKITSKSNALIKDAKRLMASSKARKEKGAFVLEGARLCFDVLNSVYKIDALFITQNSYEKYRNRAESLIGQSKAAYIITEEIAEKLTDTQTAQGIFAVCSFAECKSSVRGKKIIALDSIQNPLNMGAIIRTAEALGMETIIAYNCCDIYNPKLLRASMGSVLRMNICLSKNLENDLLSLKSEYLIYATVPGRDAKSITELDFSEPCICVIGNEANGVDEKIKALSTELITIPMRGNAESLNASVAASITMWEMLR